MPACKATGCDFQCSAPYGRCDDRCVETKTDPDNCGTCGKVCPKVTNGTAVCAGSICSVTCGAGFSRCSGACVDTAIDDVNCGGCGTKCHGKNHCVAGACRVTM
jgi:hypothetical protein